MVSLYIFSVVFQGFLEVPDNGHSGGQSGHCIWYGQCGSGFNQGMLNCPATTANRNAPRLTDPAALKILQDYCPALYNGENHYINNCHHSELHHNCSRPIYNHCKMMPTRRSIDCYNTCMLILTIDYSRDFTTIC